MYVQYLADYGLLFRAEFWGECIGGITRCTSSVCEPKSAYLLIGNRRITFVSVSTQDTYET
jgi:hypothetical protein